MTENPLGYEKIPKLLKNFAVPSIVASLVGSIYNIVDQIFIGQGVGYLGNAATNVAYPFSTICLAIALLVGIGSASRVSLCLGCKEPKAAAKAAGNGIVLMGIFGIIYLLVGETFLSLLLKAFGATTDVFPYAKQYASITLMVEAEKRMFAELVRDKRLGQDAYLPKDGSLEYKIMKSGREDLRTLQKIKHNYSWVIGVSKSFNPESCLDHTGKPNSNYIADLPVFQRFIIKPFYECLV